MELNIETAVRICPLTSNNNDIVCVQSNVYNNTVQLGNSHTYPVTYALPLKCNQNSVFQIAVTPLVNYLFEACDISVVTIGQTGTGKTYTLLGPGLNCAMSECEQGLIPRFLREMFARLAQNGERNSNVHITWSQICGENVQDLLGAGSVECTNVSDAFQLIQLGMSNLAPRCAHTLFTITLEQQFLIETTVQHRVSTASFADLAGSEKMLVVDQTGMTQSIPTDPGLLALQRCIIALTEPYASQVTTGVPYNQSALTTLLKDSFGGRAKTLLICCISPFLRDLSETFYTMQFALRAQMIKNIVTMNAYTTYENAQENLDIFGLQFAANQLFKLVSNAEELFQKIVSNGSLSKADSDRISQWLTLKQECEECLSENSEPHRSLDIIQEEFEGNSEEPSESEIDEETSLVDKASYAFDVVSQLEKKTDDLVAKHLEIMESKNSRETTPSSSAGGPLKGLNRRRVSIRSTEELSSIFSSGSKPPDLGESTSIDGKVSSLSTVEAKQKVIRAISAEVEGCERQILELEHTIAIKEKLRQQLEKHRNLKDCAKEKIKLKCEKLMTEYQSAKNKAIQAQVQNDQYNGEKFRLEVAEIQEKLKGMNSIKGITDDSDQKLKELENSMHTSRKQLEKLRSMKRKEEKKKHTIELQLKELNKSLESKKSNVSTNVSKTPSKNSLSLKNFPRKHLSDEMLENLRHEIRNLRKTREMLLEQKSKIDAKSQSKKLLHDVEDRRLIQYEEAIEAIDLAIEFKNELLCGRESLQELSVENQGDTDKMLIERLMNLSDDEMRVLLHKYFEKVVDLRTSSKKLELQVVDMECQNDNLASRVQSLSHTLQQVRLQTERRIVSLQQQHEDKLQVIMRHIAGDVTTNNKPVTVQISSTRGKITQIRNVGLPRELQGSSGQPQAKVTKQKNKLIIQQKTK